MLLNDIVVLLLKTFSRLFSIKLLPSINILSKYGAEVYLITGFDCRQNFKNYSDEDIENFFVRTGLARLQLIEKQFQDDYLKTLGDGLTKQLVK